MDWPGVCHRRESIRTYAVNCNDAWLNTEGDDISGSYVKYKDHQEVVAALEAKCAALAAEHGIQIAINELLALAPRLDKRAVDALSVAVEHLCKLIKKEAVSEQN
ncbi:hypothetical protein HEN89_017525 [Escherichia coli]|nr:hypothetical protein [Escherichia coli]MBB6997360.1 hypothetical protein [Escherichia coli]HCN8305659.1 hypothetical protein [Escherichia coli]HCO6315861.1 hypothetical protein [Escherichia coli]